MYTGDAKLAPRNLAIDAPLLIAANKQVLVDGAVASFVGVVSEIVSRYTSCKRLDAEPNWHLGKTGTRRMSFG